MIFHNVVKQKTETNAFTSTVYDFFISQHFSLILFFSWRFYTNYISHRSEFSLLN